MILCLSGMAVIPMPQARRYIPAGLFFFIALYPQLQPGDAHVKKKVSLRV